jgi:hypothetical protein
MLTRRKKIIFCLVFFTLFLLVFIPAAEILARVTGHRPWVVNELRVKVEPGGHLYTTHPTLGYAPVPGQFKVTIDDSYVFRFTNLSNSQRVTHPLNTYPVQSGRNEIWILGDSITYGWSVNDEDAFPWLLQADLPNFEIVNFGAMGYGTLQSLIQLREALQLRNKPKLIILNYASWHDVRNTFIRARRKMLAVASSLGPVNQPYARFTKDEKLEIVQGTLQYREFPLMRYSAFSNMLEETYDEYEERYVDSHKVTKAIMKEIAKLCRAEGIEVVVAALTSDSTTSDMLAQAQSEGMKTFSMFVDLSIKENNNLPFDSHPSAAAHRQYAQLLKPYLINLLQEKRQK